MRNITVNKTELIEKLKENRDEHKAVYDKAVIAYKKKAVSEIELLLEEAKAGGKIRHSISLPVPEEHTDDFTRAIEMLEWELGDTIELSEIEFANYVQNEWGWIRSFTQNTSSYVGA